MKTQKKRNNIEAKQQQIRNVEYDLKKMLKGITKSNQHKIHDDKMKGKEEW